jgi:hypothetical protein
MSASTMSPELMRLEELHERAERLCEEAAEVERAAFVAWQEAYGAYELARDEAAASWAAWVEALIP